MNYILFDGQYHERLLPLTFMRPVGEIRVGILSIREKWEFFLQQQVSHFSDSYLRAKFPLKIEDDNILILGSICPDEPLAEAVSMLKPGCALRYDGEIFAFRTGRKFLDGSGLEFPVFEDVKDWSREILIIRDPWDIFSKNDIALERDFRNITRGRFGQEINSTNQVSGEQDVFLEEGAQVNYARLNAATGPIYIGRDAEIMEGALIRGPFALGDNSTIKMGAKIYGPTTVGPHCKVGGELNNAVIFGYSNKAHDGFLGNAVIAEWCNIGADTNNSNLKNTYEEVKLWSYREQRFIKTGLQFCGLIMGDHSKCGINTMFNTGTVVGVNANIFGSGFQRNFIPSFSWGGTHGFTTFRFEKAAEVASAMYLRRNLTFDETEADLLLQVFEMTRKYHQA